MKNKKNLGFLILFLCAIPPVFSQRNCGTMQHLEELKANNPRAIQQMDKIEERTNNFVHNNQQKSSDNTITIPVVVHVVYNSSSQNLSDAQVQSQIDVLNEDFRKQNADASNTPSYFVDAAADVNVEFCLASSDPNGSPTDGITRTNTSSTSFSTNDYVKYDQNGGKSAWPSDKYLNLWVCNLSGGTLGYAQFPGSGSAATDGVVVSYKYFGKGGSAQAPFDKGRTATHEVGHWLNLRHIWGDGGCSYDDNVSDTPIASQSHYGCPSWPTSTCNSYDMYMNYMDYVDDACMNMFSNGQKDRMRSLFASGGFREGILSSNGCSGSGGGSSSSFCASNGIDASYEWIANVTVGSLNNSSGSDGGYADNTSISVDLTIGDAYNVELSPGFASDTYNEYWKIWIDYNQDGDFTDAGELAFDAGSLSSTTVNGSLTVPTTASTGSTRIRVSMKYNGAQTACEAFDYGEVEDYTVNISEQQIVCEMPSSLSTTNITETSAQTNWSNVNGADNYSLQYRASTSTTWNNTSNTQLTGLSSSTAYEWRVRTNCSSSSSDWSLPQSFTTLAPPSNSPYCASNGSNSSYEWIANVTVGDLNNSTGDNSGYSDFTSISTDLAKGSAYGVSLSPGFSADNYNEYWKIWIDYNQDGDFTDAGELAYDAGTLSSSTVTGSITVPTSALNGATRMRVSMKYNGAQTACEGFDYGEVEDYTVNIADGSASYCASQGNDASYEWIANVSINTINNSTGTDGGYADYTGISTNLAVGSSHSISLTPGFSGSSYNEYWKIWIDFNKDGDFTDANELVYDAGGLSNSTVNGTLMIPSTVDIGTTRMRVSMKYNGEQGSCEAFNYGEVEDYTVNVTPSGSKETNTISMSSKQEDVSSIKVFPNPARERFTISVQGFDDHAEISLMDMQGRILYTESRDVVNGTVSRSISTADFARGTYFVFVKEGETLLKEKVILIK